MQTSKNKENAFENRNKSQKRTYTIHKKNVQPVRIRNFT